MSTHICDLTPSGGDPESARDLLYRHALPEDVIDGVLCLHAQELAAVQRREAAVWGVDTAAGKHILGAADLIDPPRTPPAAAPAAVPPADRAGLRDWIADAVVPLLLDTLPKVIARSRGYEVADAMLALLPADSEPHRLALSEALGLGTSAPWDAIRERAAELAGLPAPVDRGAVLREAADRIEAMTNEAYERALSEDEIGYANGLENAMKELRRVADEKQQPETQAGSRFVRVCTACPECDHAVDEDGACENYCRKPAGGETVHACPPDGSGLTPCCGRTPFELPLGDRMSSEAPVTCTAPAVTPTGKEA